MSRKHIIIVLLASLSLPVGATVTIDYVTVGNAGNAASPINGRGAVSYEYQIGKYEVTNAQYGEFLNAAAKTDSYGLYNTSMASYGITRSGTSGSYTYNVTGALANRPVVFVSWFDAARMANWLANGQGNGSTETGSYTLNGATSGIFYSNIGAVVRLPSHDEWLKAGYYNGLLASYSTYPNGQSAFSTADGNYWGVTGESIVRDLANVGSYPNDASYYGTYDQIGNVREWLDEVVTFNNVTGKASVGGDWGQSLNNSASTTAGNNLSFLRSNIEIDTAGFRLVTIPEPSSLVLTALFGAGLVTRRRR